MSSRYQPFPLPGLTSLPGQALSLDKRCYAELGTTACYRDYRVCSQLFCFNPSYTACTSFHPAAEGSPCGQGRICRTGRCSSYKSGRFQSSTYNNNMKTFTGSKSSRSLNSNTIRRTVFKTSTRKTVLKSSAIVKRRIYPVSQRQPVCEDSRRRQGSLTCNDIFSRYRNIYCYNNKAIQRACCYSFRKACYQSGRASRF